MKNVFLIIIATAFIFISACRNDNPPPAATETAVPAPPPLKAAPEPESAAGNAADPDPAPATGQGSGLSKKFLIGQKFRLLKINQADYSGDRPVTLEFGEDFLIAGRVCNSFRGPGDLSQGLLKTGPLASTRMACPNETLNLLEKNFQQMLEGGANISMDGDYLYLQQGDDTLVFQADNSPPAS